MAKADLHIHTTASDGRMSQEAVIQSAVEHKLEIISITDHDTLKGYEQARKTAEDTEKLTLLPGMEITAAFDERECHLLAYCFDPGHHAIRQLVLDHYRSRLNRGQWIIEQLAREGLELDLDEVKAEARGGNIGRPHIAAVLLDKGYVGSFKEAFIRYLSDEQLGTIYNEYYDYRKVIKTVKKAGGAIVVAHPGRLYSDEELELLAQAGIDGIEVMHPSHDYQTQKHIEAFADNHSLLKTGGSDFHGSNKKYKKFFGVVTINTKHVHRMLRLTEQRKKSEGLSYEL